MASDRVLEVFGMYSFPLRLVAFITTLKQNPQFLAPFYMLYFCLLLREFALCTALLICSAAFAGFVCYDSLASYRNR